MLEKPTILLLSTDEPETESLQQTLREHAILKCARSFPEMLRLLENGAYNACFCSWTFNTGMWKDAFKKVWQHSPDLPVIVLSRVGGEQEWVQVLEAGAFDLLAAPYRTYTVLAVLEQAVASFEARTIRNQKEDLL